MSGETKDGGLVLTAADFHPDDPFAEFTTFDERMARALNAFSHSLDVKATCDAMQMTVGTWHSWRRRFPQFADMVEKIRAMKLPEVHDAHYRAALEGNVDAQKNILRANDHKYRDKQVIEVVSPEVQTRLKATADAIMLLCSTELPEPYRSTFPVKLAEKLREIWA